MERVDISIDDIRADGGTQMRVAIDEATVEDYAERLNAGESFPAIDVFYDGTDYWLAHGHHRYRAHIKAKFGHVGCNVHQGTREDAQWFSYASNKDQDVIGLRRTNADKERAVRAALSHAKAAKMSDRAIAEYVGVHHDTVNRYRKTTCLNPTPDQKREGKDGKMYPATQPPREHKGLRDIDTDDNSEQTNHGDERTHQPREAVNTNGNERSATSILAERAAKRNSITISLQKVQQIKTATRRINAMCSKSWLQVSPIELKKLVAELVDAVSMLGD
jgi:ParB-like chromosome segregation protein Spo0J